MINEVTSELASGHRASARFRSLSLVGYSEAPLPQSVFSEMIGSAVRSIGAWPNLVDLELNQSRTRRKKIVAGNLEFIDWMKTFSSVKKVDAFHSRNADFDNIAPIYSVHCFLDEGVYEVGCLVIASRDLFTLELARTLCHKFLQMSPANIGGSFICSDLKVAQFAFSIMNYEGLGPEDNPRVRFLTKAMINHGVSASQPFLAISDLNVLSSIHLDLRLEGLHFDAWIKRSGLGEVQRVSSENSIWLIPDLKLAQRAHQILYRAGLVAVPKVLFDTR